ADRADPQETVALQECRSRASTLPPQSSCPPHASLCRRGPQMHHCVAAPRSPFLGTRFECTRCERSIAGGSHTPQYDVRCRKCVRFGERSECHVLRGPMAEPRKGCECLSHFFHRSLKVHGAVIHGTRQCTQSANACSRDPDPEVRIRELSGRWE